MHMLCRIYDKRISPIAVKSFPANLTIGEETFLDLPWKTSKTFENLQIMLGNVSYNLRTMFRTTFLIRTFVRYRVGHLKRNFTSSSTHVLFFILLWTCETFVFFLYFINMWNLQNKCIMYSTYYPCHRGKKYLFRLDVGRIHLCKTLWF